MKTNTIHLIRSKGFMERLKYGKYKEAYLRVDVSIDGAEKSTSCLLGMCDKGFGFLLDSSQFGGEKTLRGLETERVKTSKEINQHALWYAIGRSQINGVKLDSFKAIAYVLGCDFWVDADAEKLMGISVI